MYNNLINDYMYNDYNNEELTALNELNEELGYGAPEYREEGNDAITYCEILEDIVTIEEYMAIRRERTEQWHKELLVWTRIASF